MPGRFSDIIVIGAGPNGLACATRLAQKGRRVTLLEAEAAPGGGARALPDLAPGYRSPALAHLIWQFDPRAEAAMDLSRHGLEWAAQGIPTTVLSPDGPLTIRGGLAEGPDAGAWATLYQRMLCFAGALEPFRRMTPPRLAKDNSWGQLAKNLLKLRALGTHDFRELLRVLLINAHDVAQDELTDPRLRAALCFDATLGAWAGPRSPNTLILWLDRLAGQIGGQRASLGMPKGGMPALAAAMARAAEAAGVTLRQGARVARIVTDGERVSGVTLADGGELRADLVISAIGPKSTLLDLVGPRALDAGLVTRLRHQKSRGGAAKLHLALSAAPDFGTDLHARMILAGDEHEVESAFNPVKYGEVPERPVMEILLPSAFDPGHAPEGGHVLSATVQFAPHDPKIGRDEARAAMLEASLARLEAAAPGIRRMIVRADLLMPYDIERQFGMAGGNWHHGELTVEQMLFLRPIPQLSRYATPIRGLWLTGAGTHPGGMSGAAGWNTAGAVLEARQ
ncbi:phytoene desaturase family protein [Pseudogemmobacter humi]|uniref:Pyridine nucleotide-disulfide oxidoreductase domain-containing protein 2 n=1 Tax=Pseudogemmobacter humi TaxID=2483812 RepID=A0A3P5WZ65_9RHOB|nr:NAD(P)/FAD-dependent oxidoreductase [Pseudogemmobacter humi]VDC21287.1 Phytoene desaturase (lycopene-forming) [Pseudogemmobacter humi]